MFEFYKNGHPWLPIYQVPRKFKIHFVAVRKTGRSEGMAETEPRGLFPELITRRGPEAVASRKQKKRQAAMEALGGSIFNAIQHAYIKLTRHELPIDHEPLLRSLERLGYCPSET